MSDNVLCVDEGIKGKLLPRFHLRVLRVHIEDDIFDDIFHDIFDDTSGEWTESAAEDLEEHQEKKNNKTSLL